MSDTGKGSVPKDILPAESVDESGSPLVEETPRKPADEAPGPGSGGGPGAGNRERRS